MNLLIRSPAARHDRTARAFCLGAAALLLLATVGGLSGCTVCQHARRTLIQEPSEYSWKYDRSRSLKAYRAWADEAWGLERGNCPELAGSEEYALGFRDGFVDFVYAGGAGEPPPVPPRKFWNLAWRTPEGKIAAEQWFAGYRHGAQAARGGGYRQGGIVHSAFAWSGAPAELAGHAIDTVPQGEILGAPIEPLPVPEAPSLPVEQLEVQEDPPPVPTPPSVLPLPQESSLPIDGAGAAASAEQAVTPADYQDHASTSSTSPATQAATTLEISANEAVAPPFDETAAAQEATSPQQRFRRAVSTVRITEANKSP